MIGVGLSHRSGQNLLGWERQSANVDTDMGRTFQDLRRRRDSDAV